MKYIQIFAIAIVLLSGCSGANVKGDGKFPFEYLKYCGDNHPRENLKPEAELDRSEKAISDRVKWLKLYVSNDKKRNPKDVPGPLDSIDAMCMHHDICYVLEGKASPACDAALAYNAKLVMDNLTPAKDSGGFIRHFDDKGKPVDECHSLCQTIGVFGLSKVASAGNPQRITDPLKTIISTPFLLAAPTVQFISYVNAGKAGACYVNSPVKYVAPSNVDEYDALVSCYKMFGDNLQQCKELPRIRRY